MSKLKTLLPLMGMALGTNTFAPSTSQFAPSREPNENIKVSLSRKPGKSKFKPKQFKKRKSRSSK